MNAKGVLISVMCIAVVAMLAGAGTLAYFSDTETSTGNTFTAGTLNLKYSTDFGKTWQDGTNAGFGFLNVAPGDPVVGPIPPKTMIFKLWNDGTIDAESLKVTWTVTDDEPTDDTEPEEDAETNIGKDIYDISNKTTVVIYYAGTNVTDAVDNAVGDDKAPLYLSELNGKTYDFEDGAGVVFTGGAEKYLNMTLTLEDDTGNEYQGDRSTVNMTFELTQDET